MCCQCVANVLPMFCKHPHKTVMIRMVLHSKRKNSTGTARGRQVATLFALSRAGACSMWGACRMCSLHNSHVQRETVSTINRTLTCRCMLTCKPQNYLYYIVIMFLFFTGPCPWRRNHADNQRLQAVPSPPHCTPPTRCTPPPRCQSCEYKISHKCKPKMYLNSKP